MRVPPGQQGMPSYLRGEKKTVNFKLRAAIIGSHTNIVTIFKAKDLFCLIAGDALLNSENVAVKTLALAVFSGQTTSSCTIYCILRLNFLRTSCNPNWRIGTFY